MPADRPLIMIVEKFLREFDLPATKFGRLSVRDPRFVLDLRMGREPRSRTRCRVEHFMNIYRTTMTQSTLAVAA